LSHAGILSKQLYMQQHLFQYTAYHKDKSNISIKMVQLNTAVQIGCFQHLYLT